MDCGGNEIQGIEKYETKSKKGGKNEKNKAVYDKVMKILGLTESELKEKN